MRKASKDPRAHRGIGEAHLRTLNARWRRRRYRLARRRGLTRRDVQTGVVARVALRARDGYRDPLLVRRRPNPLVEIRTEDGLILYRA